MLIPIAAIYSEFKTRLVQTGGAVAAQIVLATSAGAACLSPTDVQADGIVVYKCDEAGGEVGANLTEQQPANQTIILKNDDASAASVPAGADTVAPAAAVKEDAKLKDDENEPPGVTTPKKEVAKEKPAEKAKQPAKRKKQVAAKPVPGKIIHLKKPSFGQRIKRFFRLGSKPDDE